MRMTANNNISVLKLDQYLASVELDDYNRMTNLTLISPKGLLVLLCIYY